jgi:hypothetical protein
MHFYIRDPNLNLTCVELDLGVVFIFHQRVHPKLKKNLEIKRNSKKLKQKKLKTQKKSEPPEKNPFIKSDEHSNPTQNLTDSGAKFYLQIQIRMPNST